MDQIRTIGEFIGVIRRRFFLMALIVALGTFGAIYYALQQPSLYETHAALQIESASVQATNPGQVIGANSAAHRLTLIEQRLMARDSLVRVIEKLGIFDDMPLVPLNEKIDALRNSVQIVQIKDGAQAWQPNVTPSGMLITVTFGDPQRAADIANEFLGSVLEENRKRRTQQTEGALSFFQSEETRLNVEILRVEEAIAAFKSANGAALPGGLVAQRDQLNTLRETQLELDREIIEVSSNTSRARQAALEQQVARLVEQRELIESRIAQIERTIAIAPQVELELNALNRELKQYQDQYTVITTGKAEAEMGQLLADQDQTERFVVLETALVPEYPVSPSRKKLAILGFMGSGFLACLLAFGLEMMNPAIRTSAQLERQLGLQPVVSIPYVKTTWQQRRGRLAWISGLVASALALPAIYKAASDRGLSGLFQNFFNRNTVRET